MAAPSRVLKKKTTADFQKCCAASILLHQCHIQSLASTAL
eukprot:CAMPEP_0183340614 /NCGR_PEP_ID=MMETSP0164_2-20130417/7108_1 /TAXON_ID=221442 /ORGANISM="Coccolithus pelagicus ssp braarudi, Strain PLY182g" /LENGTH=39 /DNA_ID= /DNA_START= /DNA_END= /DNA_ORIENTATION=